MWKLISKFIRLCIDHIIHFIFVVLERFQFIITWLRMATTVKPSAIKIFICNSSNLPAYWWLQIQCPTCSCDTTTFFRPESGRMIGKTDRNGHFTRHYLIERNCNIRNACTMANRIKLIFSHLSHRRRHRNNAGNIKTDSIWLSPHSSRKQRKACQ